MAGKTDRAYATLVPASIREKIGWLARKRGFCGPKERANYKLRRKKKEKPPILGRKNLYTLLYPHQQIKEPKLLRKKQPETRQQTSDWGKGHIRLTLKPILSEMTDIIAHSLAVSSKGKLYSLHDLWQVSTFFLCLQNQMNVILHQGVMADLEFALLFVSTKTFEVLLVVNFILENILTVISPGKNVKYMIPWRYPRYSWHNPMLMVS
jgi:hypothetical protein